MSKRILTILLVLLSITVLFSADLDREITFKEGISAYVAEDYDRSIQIFQGLINGGEISWELYYNLANAYYRKGELGNAIRYWEKASIISSSQADIHYNLNIAEQRLIDKVVLPEVFPLFKWYRELRTHVDLAGLVFIMGLLLFITLLLLGIMRYRKREKNASSQKFALSILIVLLSCILIMTIFGLDASNARKDLQHAVILENTVNIYSEPDEDSQVLFVLHEGSKVKVNKKIEDIWMNISYFDDKIGWIKSETLGEIEE